MQQVYYLFIDRKKNSLIKILWMMYVLFPFRIKGISLLQNLVYYLFSIVLAGLVIMENRKGIYRVKYLKSTFYYLFTLLLLTLLTVAIPAFKDTHDYSYFQYYIYYWGRIVILLGVLYLDMSIFEFIDLIIEGISAYVIGTIILMIPSIRSVYMEIVLNDTINSARAADLYSAFYYTRFGLQGFAGFSATFLCSVSVMLCCYMIVEAFSHRVSRKRYYFLLLISLLGNFFYGRVGVIASFAVFLFTVLYLLIIYKRFKFVFIIIISLLIGAKLFVKYVDVFSRSKSLYWIFEGGINFVKYGRFETMSSNKLLNAVIQPSVRTVLLGDGYYTSLSGGYYMSTDVGYLRPLLFGGIIFEAIYYSLLLPEFSAIYHRLRNENGLLFLILCGLVIIFFEMKGEELLDFSNILFLLMLSTLLEKNRMRIQQ